MTRYALVPVEATEEMANALTDMPDSMEWGFQNDYARMIAASPGQGTVTAEQLEAAVASLSALWKRGEPFPTAERQAATVIAALGLTVQP